MRAKTVSQFKNIYTSEIAEYKMREIVDGGLVLEDDRTVHALYTVHILLRGLEKVEDRWNDESFRRCWERVNPC